MSKEDIDSIDDHATVIFKRGKLNNNENDKYSFSKAVRLNLPNVMIL